MSYPIEPDSNIFGKTKSVCEHWLSRKLNRRLRALIVEFAQILLQHGKACVITSIYRPDPGGIHSLWRAADVRSQDLTPEEAESIRVDFNARHPYGLKSNGKPGETIPPLNHAAAQNTTSVSAPHFHIQVSASA